MATWIGPGSEYTTAANWNPADVPDTAGETATFTNNSAPTSVTVSSIGHVGGFTFDALAPTYTISLSGTGTALAFAGAGIVNNSGVAQNLSTGTGAGIQFQGSATAGNATITVNSGECSSLLIRRQAERHVSSANGGFFSSNQLWRAQHRLA